MLSDVNLWPLIGVAVIIAGFILRFNPMLVVIVTAIATAFAEGFPIDKILATIGAGFVKTRNLPLSISQPLAVIGDPDRLWLLLDIPESLAGRLQTGLALRVPAADGRTLHATLQHVDDFVDSERRVVQARAELDNPARSSQAGHYVRPPVALPAPGGVSLPAAALLPIPGTLLVSLA